LKRLPLGDNMNRVVVSDAITIYRECIDITKSVM